MKKQRNLRSMAAQAVEQVVEQGQSLSNILPPLQQKVSDKDKALLQELCFGVLRTLSQLDWLINKLMARPMTARTCASGATSRICVVLPPGAAQRSRMCSPFCGASQVMQPCAEASFLVAEASAKGVSRAVAIHRRSQ